jgi:hypothetical protein
VRVRKSNEHNKGYSIVPVPYEVESPRMAECPVSAITQRSIELVQVVTTMISAKSAGATVDLERMPGYVVDAIRVIEREKAAQEAAQDEAVNNA